MTTAAPRMVKSVLPGRLGTETDSGTDGAESRLKPACRIKSCPTTLAICFVLLCACHRHRPEQAESALRAGQHDLLEGSLAPALDRAHSGSRDWRDRPQSEPYIRFKLLEADVLIKQLQTHPAVDLLTRLRTPEGSRLDVQRRIKRSSALCQLQDYAGAQKELNAAGRYAQTAGWKGLLAQAAVIQLLLLPASRTRGRGRAHPESSRHGG